MYGSPLFLRVVLCASAAISNAILTSSLSPGFNFGFMDLSNARYSRRINFFSCSSFKLYFGSAATVSIPYEFTEIEEFLILISNLLHLRPDRQIGPALRRMWRTNS